MARCKVALFVWLVAGCGGSAEKAPRCELLPAHVVRSAEAPRFDSVALDVRGEVRLAAWSERAGLFARRLAPHGAPDGAEVRIGERCQGGVALALTEEGALIGCVRPNGDEDASEVALYTLDEALSVKDTRSLGRAGRDGRGIAVARDGARTYVAYSEGLVGAHTVRRILLEGDHTEDRVVSRPGRAGSEPSLFVDKGAVHAVFTETDYDAPAQPVVNIVAVDEHENTRTLRKVNVPNPSPSLTRDDRGLVLTYRDRVGSDRRAELYALRLHDDLTKAGEPVKVGRANTEGAPRLFVCGTWRLGLLPREYADERYVAIHALGPRLENLSGGHQFYANSREFVLASGACAGEELLFLAGEQKSPADRGVDLMAMRFRCTRGE